MIKILKKGFMQNTIPAVVIAVALSVSFQSCQKEESAPDADQQMTNTIDVWLFNSNDGSVVQKTIDFNDLQLKSASKDLKQSNSAHTHGSFSNEQKSITWSGTQNNGGPHGSATVTLNYSDPAMVLTLETECVMVDGNKAVYGGTITATLNVPDDDFIQVGGHYYFAVIDNGQGNNAPPDQFSNVAVLFPACGIFLPNDFIWTLFGFSDVEAPGSVKVNN